METKIATSITQSKKLIELGIDVNTADMIHNVLGEPYVRHGTPIDEYHTPAWSLSALLCLIKPVNENSYTIQGTLDGGAIISFEEVTCVAFQESNILDAAFEMVCYLLENKIIK